MSADNPFIASIHAHEELPTPQSDNRAWIWAMSDDETMAGTRLLLAQKDPY